MKNRLLRQYHWLIALVVLIEMAVYGGFINNANSLYLLPVTEDFGISRGTYALVFSLRSLMAFLSTMISGVLLLRFGYRRMIAVSLLVGSLGCVLAACARELFWFGFAMAVVGLCDGCCATAGASQIISTWFHRRRGTVLGVVTAFTGIGGSAFCVVYSTMIESSGFRQAFLATGLFFAATAVILVLVVRDHPEQLHLIPYGEGEQTSGAAPEKKRWAGWSLGELLRKPIFYLMLGATLLGSICMYLSFYVVVPHMRDCGLNQAQAALVQSVMLLLLAAAKVLSGWLCDKIGARRTTVLCVLCIGLGTWLQAGVHSLPGALLATVIFSLGLPITSVTIPLLTGSLFGYRAHDTAAGIFLSMVAVGGMIASPIMNLAYDALGSYSPALRVTTLLCAAVIGLYLILFRLTAREKQKEENAQ